MTPEQVLAHTQQLANDIRQLTTKSVYVGLPQDKVGQKIYNNNQTIFQIGAIHEFGSDSRNIPPRSFLRNTFQIKRNEINNFIKNQWNDVFHGKINASKALDFLGITGTNMAKQAFTTNGYGTWTDIKEQTKKRKGSSAMLIDTGTLRNSITWVIRNA